MIRIVNLTHSYKTPGQEPVVALREVNIEIADGEYVAVVGANGSGKTTLARHLNALLLPTAGEVWVDGRNTRDPVARRAIRADVGMVFQFPEDQFVATTVLEDVAFGPENLGVPRAEIRRRVRAALERVGMWEARHRPPHLLSAGQQQRVAIAGVLAMNPRCLVLDEATAMLDPRARRQVLDLLDELHRDGLTIIAITHHMAEAARARRVIALHRGRIALDGPPSDVLASPLLPTLGLAPPPARRLRWRVPSLPSDLFDGRRGGQPMIKVEGLYHTYMADTPLACPSLHGVNLTVERRQVVALIGATGSGKSTLLQHLNGLWRPQHGQVLVDGRDLGDPHTDLRQIRRLVGLVFQKPEDQLFERYVGDDIAYGPRMAGLRGAELRERVRWAMEWAGLDFERYKDRLIATLSGGERRKVGLAGVLAMHPQALLLDEPTAGLDPAARYDLILRLQALHAQGMTMVIATHNMDDVAALADRVYVLAEGRIALHGPALKVLAQADLLQA